jgi:hypothetical protein
MSGHYSLALQEARRSMDQQVADLDRIRNQTTTVFAVALFAFLLSALWWSNDPQPDWYTRGASFIVVVISGLWGNTCWPRGFTFTQDSAVLVRWVERPDEPSHDAQTRQLALFMGEAYEKNRAKLSRLVLGYQVSLVVLLFEIAWLLASLP